MASQNPTPKFPNNWRALFTHSPSDATTSTPVATSFDESGLLMDVPDEILQETTQIGSLCLVGNVPGARPNIDDIRRWVRTHWATKGAVEVMAMANQHFMFSFSNQEDKDLIFSQGLWMFGKQGLYLQQWHPNFDPFTSKPSTAPIWVVLPNLPFCFWHK